MQAQKDTAVPTLKEMEVCDICGAFLIVGDAKQRAEEHLMGKQHMGYAKIRITVQEIIVSCNPLVSVSNQLKFQFFLSNFDDLTKCVLSGCSFVLTFQSSC